MNKQTFIIICGLIFLFTLFSDRTLGQNSYASLCNQGLEYEKIGNLDGAISKYTDAIITTPELWTEYSYIANANYKNQKYDDPIEDLDVYFSADTNHLAAIFSQGFTFLKAGDTTNAKTNALRIIELDPAKEIFFSGEHLLDIYDLEMRRKIVRQSLEDAKTYIVEYKTTPSKTLGNIKLAQAFAKLNKAWLYSSGIQKEDRDLQDTVIKYIFEVYPEMKEKPELPELARKFMVQANNATDEKKYDDAIELWNKASSIAPYFPSSYFNRALLRESVEDYTNAIPDMKKYIELSPEASNIRIAKDKIYGWEGRVQPLEEIVKKYTVANKLDKIANLSTIKITSKILVMFMELKISLRNEIWMKNPDKVKTVITAKGYKTVSVFDGEKGYSIDGSKAPVEMTPDKSRETLNNIIFKNSMANYLKNGQLSLEGEEKVNNKPAFKLKVKYEGVDITFIYMYIDKESYLLVKSVTIGNAGGETYTVDSYPSNYAETNGVFLPMVLTTITRAKNGKEETTTMTKEKVEVNIPMEDAIFKVIKK